MLTGFLVFTVFSSFINFVNNGFTLVDDLSGNPNATIAENQRFQYLLSFPTSKSQASCQNFNLPINSEFFTNQSALTYTLTDVWQPAMGPQDETPTFASSLVYSNNVLENCTVRSIEIDLAPIDRSANQFAYAEWGATLRSFATRAITQGSNGTAMVDLTQEYDYVPSTVSLSGIHQFLGSGFI